MATSTTARAATSHLESANSPRPCQLLPGAFGPVDLWAHLFGDAHGWLCIASGPRVRGKLPSLAHSFFHWPEEGLAAADHVIAENRAGLEVFFCPHLLTRRARLKECAAPVTTLYADADGPVNLSVVPSPTAIVRSSARDSHLYWALRRALPAAEAEALNRRLTYAIGADRGCWNLGRILRVPGTRNNKYLDEHVVVAVEIITRGAYDPDDLDRALPPAVGKPRDASRLPEQPTPRGHALPTPSGEPFFRSARWEALLRDGDREHRYTQPGSAVDRSRVDQALVVAAINEGRDFEALFGALLDRAHRGGAKVQQLFDERGEAAARAYRRHGWARACDLRPRSHPLTMPAKR